MPRKTESVDVAFRYSVAQASRELGLTPVALSRRLREKRIEPVDGTYSLRQLVDCMLEGDSPSDRNAEARAELAADRSRLIRLEIGEKEGSLIPRDGAVEFMGGLMKALYNAVHWAELNEADRQLIEKTLQEAGTEYYARGGWALEPLTFAANGEGRANRPAKWASLVCSLVHRAMEEKKKDDQRSNRTEGAGRPPKPLSGRGRAKMVERQADVSGVG